MERFTLVCFGVVLLASVTYSCGGGRSGGYIVRTQPQPQPQIVIMMPSQDSGGSSTGTPSAQDTNSIRRRRSGDTGVVIPPSPSPNQGTGTGNGNTAGPPAGPYSGNGNNPGNVTGATVVRANIEGRGTLQTLILSRSGQPGVAIIQPQSPDQDTGTNNGNAAIPPTVPNNGNDINPGNSNGNNPGNDNGNSPGNGNGNNPGTLPAPRSATVLESLARIEGRGTLLHTSRRRRSCQQTPTVVLVQQTQPNQSTGSQPDTGNATGITTGSGTSSNTSSSTFTGSGTISFIPAESAAINNGNTSPKISNRRRREDNPTEKDDREKRLKLELSKKVDAKANFSVGAKDHKEMVTSEDGSGRDKGISNGKVDAHGFGYFAMGVSHRTEHMLPFATKVGEKTHETEVQAAEQVSSSAAKSGVVAVSSVGAAAGFRSGAAAKFVEQSPTHARPFASYVGVAARHGYRAAAKSESVDHLSTHDEKLGVKVSEPAVAVGKLNYVGISSPSEIVPAPVKTPGAGYAGGIAQVTKLGEEHAGRVVGPAHAVEGALASTNGEHGKTGSEEKRPKFPSTGVTPNEAIKQASVQHSVAVNGSVGLSGTKEVKVLKQSKE